jgi:glutamyl-tRNA(Gln) amidotransferase subunit E
MCKVIRKSLDKNQRVVAVKLPKFKGFLKGELAHNFRLGTELADRARFWGRVGGIFHTDEMPAYGVTADEIEQLESKLETEEKDAVVFVADTPENVRDALRAVVERAREALEGVPEETRASNQDGTTRFMRPRPGAARMYPETDIPPVQVTEEHVEWVSSHLPELPEQKLHRLAKEYRLNEKLAKQILDSEYGELFEVIAKESKVSATTVAAFMTETMKALKRDGVPVERIPEAHIRDVFKCVGSGQVTKEAVSEIVIWLAQHEGSTVQEATRSIGLKMLSKEELEKTIEQAIQTNRKLIEERGANAHGAIIGIVMKRVRGKADAALASELVKQKLENTKRK